MIVKKKTFRMEVIHIVGKVVKRFHILSQSDLTVSCARIANIR